MGKYFTKSFYLKSIEEDLMRIHRVIGELLNDEDFILEFEFLEEFYEEDEDYRNFINDFKELGRKIEPEVVDLLDRVLTLRKKYIKD